VPQQLVKNGRKFTDKKRSAEIRSEAGEKMYFTNQLNIFLQF
jgi:hypothetical protein